MTREENIKAILETCFASCKEELVDIAVDSIISLKEEPCEDAVSRKAVEKITWEEPSYSDALNVLTEVRDKVRALPSVTPTHKKGKWIVVDNIHSQCMECGAIFCISSSDKWGINYCPNCGADMREVEE